MLALYITGIVHVFFISVINREAVFGLSLSIRFQSGRRISSSEAFIDTAIFVLVTCHLCISREAFTMLS